LTKKLRDQRENARIAKYTEARLRVYLPNRLVLQGYFHPKVSW
jgi:hypothetical protein